MMFQVSKYFGRIEAINIIKNVSSSTSHKKTPSLHLYGNLRFIYESILIKININANIMNTQIFN